VGRLAAYIAHEINNPLESLTNLLYLSRTADSPEAREQSPEKAKLELHRLSVISNQTLRLHKQSTSRRPMMGEDLVESVLSMYQVRTNNCRVEVERRMRARTPVVCFDGEIRQVLGNLVSNAIDALPPTGGLLLIRTREGRQWHSGRKGLIFTIADTGEGMSEQTRAKIFHPFFHHQG
jgi:signal transduction histidine kinase